MYLRFVAAGVLLCKHHHLLAHNNHWEISVTSGVTSPGSGTGSDYWLIPPPGIDPEQTPIPMPSKSAAMHELLAASTG